MDSSPTGPENIRLIKVTNVERGFGIRLSKGEGVLEDATVRLLEADEIRVNYGFEEFQKTARSQSVFNVSIRIADGDQLEACLPDPREGLWHPWKHA